VEIVAIAIRIIQRELQVDYALVIHPLEALNHRDIIYDSLA
jgi:hypothetical protein